MGRNGDHAIATDPGRDSVYVVDLAAAKVSFTIRLQGGDQPARVVEDGAGRVHVVLRSGGALATIDPVQGTILERRNVCPAPRGAAWDPATDLVWVACGTGELVALPAAGGEAVHSFVVERDLRDIVINDGALAVTKFRSAEVLRISTDGTITRRDRLPSPQPSFTPHVAWRSAAGPSGSIVAVHQAETTNSLQTTVPGGYGGGGCSLPGSFGFASSSGPVSVSSSGVSPTGVDASSRGSRFVSMDAAAPDVDSDAATIGSNDGGSVLPVDAVAPDALDDGATGVDAVAAGENTAIPLGSVDAGALQCLAFAGGVSGAGGYFAIGANSSSSTPLGPQAAGGGGFFGGGSGGLGGGPAPFGCGASGAVISVLTALGPDGSTLLNTSFRGVLPVDVALSSDGVIAAVAPGNAFTSGLGTVFVFDSCGNAIESASLLAPANADGGSPSQPQSEQPVAVAFDSANRLLVQTRQPGEIHIFARQAAPIVISLSTISNEDTGHAIFHTQAGALIACASCHPEGGDDGHVWVLEGAHRRTPSLQGTIAGTAPYHWPGDQPTLDILVNDVYTIRMSGPRLPPDEMDALTGWVQAVPRPPAPAFVDPSAVARGEALFERGDVGCSSCHSGIKFTNNLTVDVGTGGAFQVPPLVGVGWRIPLMHDGCAASIADRFGRCATPQHGSISGLSAAEINDLIAYLETL